MPAARPIAATVLLGLAAGLSPLLQADAAAQSGTCVSLERRLASLRPSGPSARYLQYDEAVREQERQLDKAHHMAWRAGCSGGSFFGAGNARRCDELAGAIDHMEANLAMLTRTRDRYRPAGATLERSRIEAALEAHGCRGGEIASVPDAPQVPVFDDLRSSVDGDAIDGTDDSDSSGSGSGMISVMPDIPFARYRTLCVRTCDGYYFPISFGATPDDFMRDQSSCQARCPGADAELYYTRPEDEPETMVSLTGEPYTALPNAFRYRKAGVSPSCSCQVARGGGANPNYSILGNGSVPAVSQPDGDGSSIVRSVSPATPDIIEQPQTGGPKAPPAEQKPAAGTNESKAPAEGDIKRKVRVVGPTFLPDPSKAIDLRAPARKDDR